MAAANQAQADHRFFIVDPQFDFCNPSGSLYVPGAEQDISRIAHIVRKALRRISAFYVSLDSHQRLHVGHGEMWRDRNGRHPDPFTNITSKAYDEGEFRAAYAHLQGYLGEYLRQLEANGRYTHTIWPPHCLIGTIGATVMPELQEALDEWCLARCGTVNWIPKGSHYGTEHFSALRADVIRADDHTTDLNMHVVHALEGATSVAFGGEAASHCVANTVKDVLDNFSDPASIRKVILLTDCQSSVPGCEHLAQASIDAGVARGMRVMTSAEYLDFIM